MSPAPGNILVKRQVDGDLLKRSALYREYLAEREEILKLKWVESEKAGSDIGLDSALVSWVVHHRARWQQARQRHDSPPI